MALFALGKQTSASAASIGLKTMSKELKERIAADFKEAAADGSIASRLAAIGSVINVGGPNELFGRNRGAARHDRRHRQSD